jgi:hypothetical protein
MGSFRALGCLVMGPLVMGCCVMGHFVMGHFVMGRFVCESKSRFRFQCSICDYASVEKAALEKHHRFKHTNERPFMCDTCGFR